MGGRKLGATPLNLGHANPLLREPLRAEHIKARLFGHFGSDPGQTFIWAHHNRIITRDDQSMIYRAAGLAAFRPNQLLGGAPT